MTTPQTRRIEHLEARRGGPAVGRMIAYVAESCGLSPAAVIAEAENIMAATRGMTEAERNARLAADLGRTPAEIEADLAEVAEEFVAWQWERTP
jgi:hypothetical protein